MSTDVIMSDKQPDSHLKSPFQLNNRDKPLRMISLTQSLPSPDGSGTNVFDMSPTSSTSSGTSEVTSPKSVFGANPFSLSVKKVGNVNLSTPSSLTSNPSPTSPVLLPSTINREGLSQEQKIIELQKEMNGLRKDIEAKDAKLSSSVKSIKQFWSPELKKERAARKDESERCMLLKEKYQISNTQIEEYKKTLEDLESELNSQQQQINKLTKQLQTSKNNDNNNSELLKEIRTLKDDQSHKDDEIFILNRTLDDFERKYAHLEEECNEKHKCISDLEIILVEQEKHEKEHETVKEELQVLYHTLTSRENELENMTEELGQSKDELKSLQKKFDKQQKSADELYTTVKEKDRRIATYKRDLAKYEHESADLKTQCEEVEKKFHSEEEMLGEFENEVASLKDSIMILENALTKQEELLESTKRDVEILRKKDEENIEKINELEDLFLAKDKEYDMLQSELKVLQAKMNEHEANSVERKSSSPAEIEWLKDVLLAKEKELNITQKKALSMRGKVEDAEKIIGDLEEELKRSNEVGSGNDKTLEQKEKEIQDLKTKYDKLDKYLSEREVALENCRDEMKDLKTNNTSFNIIKDQLENQIYEQKTLIERLERQKERYSKPQTDIVNISVFNELKQKNEEMVKSTQNNESKLKELKEKLKALNTTLSVKDKQLETLQDKYEAESNKVKEQIEEITKLQSANEKLKKESEEAKRALLDVDKQRPRATSEGRTQVKETKTTKHLWDELSKKESKIEDLEKQVKEKSRQLAALKKSQSAEKKEQHQLVIETKKAEIENQTLQTQEESEKKEKRIIMLEDALRESVCIAAEREDILARHVEMSEEASKKLLDSEGEYDRVVIEKAITSIKNAFLILSLSERDALNASMKAARKRQIEELMNMKQDGLLSAISEKDTQIAHLELQASKNKRQEIKNMKADKERLVNELKEQNNVRMTTLNNEDNRDNLIMCELQDAPAQQVYEALRLVSTSSSKLEFYIEEFMAFLREKNVELLKDMTNLPRKKARPVDKLKKSNKEELMKELNFVEEDSMQLKKYVEKLLDKLEGPPC